MTAVGFTGTREQPTQEQRHALWKVLDWLEIDELHHGDCVGADSMAHFTVASMRGPKIVIHPPLDPRLRAFCPDGERREPDEYLVRNRAIVDETSVLVAVVQGKERPRSGTWSTVRYARSLIRPVLVIWSDGTVSQDEGGRR